MTALTDQRTTASRSRPVTVVVAILAFLSLGLPDGALGVAWPSIRTTFGLSLSQLGTLLTASMCGYLFASASSGRLVEAIGVGHLLTASTAIMAGAATGYALAPGWWTMVACGVGAGLGSGAIDAGLNAYAAHHFSPRATNWMHATFGLGATTGPLLMTALITRGASWRWGYAVIAMMMAALTVTFVVTHRVWANGETDATPGADDASDTDRVSTLELLRRPRIGAGIMLFFAYVGLEFCTGQWAFSYLTQSRGVPTAIAGTAVGLFWAGLTAGRVILGGLTTWISHTLILRIAFCVAPVAALAIAWRGHDAINIAGLALMGFTLAPIFPLMVSVTPDRVGKLAASHAIGFQIAASSLGGAGIPALAGILAKRFGLEIIGTYLVVVACVLLVLHEVTVRLARPING
jgi:fucose permease